MIPQSVVAINYTIDCHLELVYGDLSDYTIDCHLELVYGDLSDCVDRD